MAAPGNTCCCHDLLMNPALSITAYLIVAVWKAGGYQVCVCVCGYFNGPCSWGICLNG